MNNSPTTKTENLKEKHDYAQSPDYPGLCVCGLPLDISSMHHKPKEKDHAENILVKTNSFEKFLALKHAESYIGTDDDMPDAFEHWLSELEIEDLIQYGNEALQ